MFSYLSSFFSLKKLIFKDISFLSCWDTNSSFTRFTRLGRFTKLKNTKIDRYSRIDKHSILANVTVGRFCSIAANARIGLGRHPLNYLSTHSIFYKKNSLKNDWVSPINFSPLPVVIGHDVWIGINCIIVDGVKIGNGAVIGAGAVVTKDIPPYAIAVGVPARVVKYRFTPDVIDRLQDIKWWNWSDDEISSKILLFRESDLTMEVLNKYLD